MELINSDNIESHRQRYFTPYIEDAFLVQYQYIRTQYEPRIMTISDVRAPSWFMDPFREERFSSKHSFIKRKWMNYWLMESHQMISLSIKELLLVSLNRMLSDLLASFLKKTEDVGLKL